MSPHGMSRPPTSSGISARASMASLPSALHRHGGRVRHLPPKLPIRCFVNGEKRQDSNTGLQIFDIDHVIAELSQGMTLKAGTIIATGTPAASAWAWNRPASSNRATKFAARSRHRHPDEHSPLSNSYSVLYYFARFLLIRCIFAQDGSLFTNNSY